MQVARFRENAVTLAGTPEVFCFYKMMLQNSICQADIDNGNRAGHMREHAMATTAGARPKLCRAPSTATARLRTSLAL